MRSERKSKFICLFPKAPTKRQKEGRRNLTTLPPRKNAYEKIGWLGFELFSKTFFIFISIQRELKISQKLSLRKIVNDEIIFVRSKGAKAQHTLAYVSISLSADSCKKNSSERDFTLRQCQCKPSRAYPEHHLAPARTNQTS